MRKGMKKKKRSSGYLVSSLGVQEHTYYVISSRARWEFWTDAARDYTGSHPPDYFFSCFLHQLLNNRTGPYQKGKRHQEYIVLRNPLHTWQISYCLKASIIRGLKDIDIVPSTGRNCVPFRITLWPEGLQTFLSICTNGRVSLFNSASHAC